MWLFISIALMLSGYWLDVWTMLEKFVQIKWHLNEAQWQLAYSTIRDLQFVGFAMFAFELCPFKRVELKVMAFLIVWWRVFVTCINALNLSSDYSPWFVIIVGGVYLLWLGKTWGMEELEDQEEQDGAYYFLMPIHSVWGLLKAIFIPWRHARYESIVLVQGDLIWAVNNKAFVVRSTYDTDLSQRDGVRRYIGRDLTTQELVKLNSMVGKRAIPGIRDCRKLRIV